MALAYAPEQTSPPRWPWVAGATAALLVFVGPMLIILMGVMSLPALQDTKVNGSPLCASGAAAALNLTPEQQSNAAAIISTGQQMGVPTFGQQIAVATALQESTLRVLDYGDAAGPDSRGLFQQRDSWGPLEVRMDPEGSARLFYDALLMVPGWEQLALTDAAATVQRPAEHLRGEYAKWEAAAGDLVAAGTAGTDACAPAVAPVGPGGWTLPLDRYTLTARFGECAAYWSRCHTGLDFAAPIGTPIRAAAAGVVVAAGYGVHGSAYGNLTEIDHGGGVHTWYAHQSGFNVTPGQRVEAGQAIGLVGATGNVTGPHLHFEVLVGANAVDPFAFLTQQGLQP